MPSGISYILNSDGTPGESWSPFSGCNGPFGVDGKQHRCFFCYSERSSHRYGQGFDPAFHAPRLKNPGHWAKPRTVATCFQADMFDPAFTAAEIDEVFRVMRAEHRHQYLFVSKQAQRMGELWDHGDGIRSPWGGRNVWAGVTVTGPEELARMDALLEVGAGTRRWVSLEPLLQPVRLPFPVLGESLDAVVVGGMSGDAARRYALPARWVREVRDQCEVEQIPFIFKQWGCWHPADWKGEATHAVEEAAGRVLPIRKSEPGSETRSEAPPEGWQGLVWREPVESFPLLDGVRHDYLPWAGRRAKG